MTDEDRCNVVVDCLAHCGLRDGKDIRPVHDLMVWMLSGAMPTGGQSEPYDVYKTGAPA